MEPLWKISSGKFAGYRDGEALYDATGKSVGYFRGEIAYSPNGRYLGEMYDDDYIGKRSSGCTSIGPSRASRAGIARAARADRAGRAVAGWSDPNF